MRYLRAATFVVASVLLVQAWSLAQTLGKFSILQVNVKESPLKATLNEQIRWDLDGPSGRITSFHVRVFRGDLRYNTTTMKTLTDKNGCILYQTWVLYAQANGELHVTPLSDIGALSYSGGHFADATLTLVFEAGNESVSPVIRLHKTQLPAYFKYAKVLVVSPDAVARSLEPQIAAQIANALNQSRDAGASSPPKSWSFRQRHVTTSLKLLIRVRRVL
jgi:hypothetical protein